MLSTTGQQVIHKPDDKASSVPNYGEYFITPKIKPVSSSQCEVLQRIILDVECNYVCLFINKAICLYTPGVKSYYNTALQVRIPISKA